MKFSDTREVPLGGCRHENAGKFQVEEHFQFSNTRIFSERTGNEKVFDPQRSRMRDGSKNAEKLY